MKEFNLRSQPFSFDFEKFERKEHNSFLYEKKCICKEEKEKKKNLKPDLKKRIEGKPVRYPSLDETNFKTKTFKILYKNALSLHTKLILNSFQKKYFYYAIDDILYTVHLNLIERDNLLALIYSPILSLQNDYSVDFFDTWIHELYIKKISKPNKFLIADLDNSYQITVTVLYKIKSPPSKQRILW